MNNDPTNFDPKRYDPLYDEDLSDVPDSDLGIRFLKGAAIGMFLSVCLIYLICWLFL